MKPTLPIHMHIIGTFATGQQRGILIIWSPTPIGSFATTQHLRRNYLEASLA